MPAEPFKYDGKLDPDKTNRILQFCDESVLDIGCNTGELVGYLSTIGIHAEGIDIDEGHIRTAKLHFPASSFHVGSDLSRFADNQFKTVVVWDVLEHIPDDFTALGECLRIASSNVILSVPKEDEISLPHSRVTYRPYVDPTHVHYYSRAVMTEMLNKLGRYRIYFEDFYRVRPLMAYVKIGIPFRVCNLLDRLFWKVGHNTELFYGNLMVVITKNGSARQSQQTHSALGSRPKAI